MKTNMLSVDPVRTSFFPLGSCNQGQGSTSKDAKKERVLVLRVPNFRSLFLANLLQATKHVTFTTTLTLTFVPTSFLAKRPSGAARAPLASDSAHDKADSEAHLLKIAQGGDDSRAPIAWHKPPNTKFSSSYNLSSSETARHNASLRLRIDAYLFRESTGHTLSRSPIHG